MDKLRSVTSELHDTPGSMRVGYSPQYNFYELLVIGSSQPTEIIRLCYWLE